MKFKAHIQSLAERTLAIPRSVKRLVALAVDASLCVITVWLAFSLRYEEIIRVEGPVYWAMLGSVGLALPIFTSFGLYRAIFHYAGMNAFIAVAKAVGVYALIYSALFTAVGMDGVPRSTGLIQPLLLLLAVGSARATARVWLGDNYLAIVGQEGDACALIYGAGAAGRQLASALSQSTEIKVRGYVDDDKNLHRRSINGLTVYRPSRLERLIQDEGITDILLALPSCSRQRRNEIIESMRHLKVAVRSMPGLMDLAQGKVKTAELRELDIDELLGRVPVQPESALLAENHSNKVVLVTGAGGSIGSELCRQILATGPKKLVLVDMSEYGLYQIHAELEAKGLPGQVVPYLGSVLDKQRMAQLIKNESPETIYHAAAYKHVPLVEANPAVGVENNVFGTKVMAELALEYQVSRFVLISTDKAVRPTNVMGASKRVAEMVLQALQAEFSASSTVFCMVRFGNVLGSSGSVVPKFRQQIKSGGPITLTHPDITRYFMTIPEAAQLVIQAGAMAKGGEVFVLDMGESVKIIDLARRMIELSGLSVRDEQDVDGDIAIEITGLRPGEKLYEELLIGDNPEQTDHAKIMMARDGFLGWAELGKRLLLLAEKMKSNDVQALRKAIFALITCHSESMLTAEHSELS